MQASDMVEADQTLQMSSVSYLHYLHSDQYPILVVIIPLLVMITSHFLSVEPGNLQTIGHTLFSFSDNSF